MKRYIGILMSERMETLVSVVIPVYQVQDYIRDCLDSVLKQTYVHLEILAVDDGSTDDSGKILDAYALGDPRIKVIHQANGGLSCARNTGIEHASGSVFCFIDGDDTIDPRYVELLLARMQETGAEISVCDMEYRWPDGKTMFSAGGDFDCSSVQSNPDLIRINNSACNKLFASKLFASVRFPVGKLYEDLATVPILLARANKVCKVNEPLYIYRQAREGSIRHHVDERIFDLYDAIEGVLREVQGQKELEKAVRTMYIIHCLDGITLKIKDMDEKEKRVEYLKKNMDRLSMAYPNYCRDDGMKRLGWKRELIHLLLKWGQYQLVLRMYDR